MTCLHLMHSTTAPLRCEFSYGMKGSSDSAIFMSVLCVSKHFSAFKRTENLLLLESDQLLCCCRCLPNTAVVGKQEESILCAGSDLTVRNITASWLVLMEKGVSGWEGRESSVCASHRDLGRPEVCTRCCEVCQGLCWPLASPRALMSPITSPPLPFLCVEDSRGQFNVGSWVFFLLCYLYLKILWFLTGHRKVYLTKVCTSADFMKIQVLCKSQALIILYYF